VLLVIERIEIVLSFRWIDYSLVHLLDVCKTSVKLCAEKGGGNIKTASYLLLNNRIKQLTVGMQIKTKFEIGFDCAQECDN